MPVMQLTIVDLPEPFGPINPEILPRSTNMLASYRATKPENLLVRLVAARTGSPAGSCSATGIIASVTAMNLGGMVIERHITLDKKMSGPDHGFSIDPNGLKSLISQIHEIDQMKGDGIKIPAAAATSLVLYLGNSKIINLMKQGTLR